jgi:hypothetical protein
MGCKTVVVVKKCEELRRTSEHHGSALTVMRKRGDALRCHEELGCKQ